MVWEQSNIHMQKQNLLMEVVPSIKINSECITHPNVKRETETSRRKHWGKPYTTKSMPHIEKKDIFVLIKIYLTL